mmetsp:Transcript_26185/g.78977  ORF Transcript_26185/g.78977 Transcript_26185/m.78977 type:complete len:238 (+) Transcript_26185:79-792(+)
MASRTPMPLVPAACLLLGLGVRGDVFFDPVDVTNITRFPSYNGPLSVRGRIGLGYTGEQDRQQLNWDLFGTDPACHGAQAPLGQSACGVRVRTGTSCLEAGEIGGDFWNTALYSQNPWGVVVYNTSGGWARSGGVFVTTGLTNADVVGRVLAVFDANGVGIACAVITAATTSTITATTTSATTTTQTTTTGTSPNLTTTVPTPSGARPTMAAWPVLAGLALLAGALAPWHEVGPSRP